MRRIIPFLLFSVILLLFNSVSAQNMGALNAMLARQNMNMQMQMNMNARQMWALGSNENYNPKHTFLITMIDGSKKEVYSRIYADTVAHKSYLVFEDKSLPKSDTNRVRKIYPQQTINITRNMALAPSIIKRADFPTVPKYYTGIAKDSCWMFKVIAGPVSAYSLLSEEEGQMFNPGTIVAIQLNDGPIVKCTEENLKTMVAHDAEAMEKIQDKNYLKAIKKFNRNIEKTAAKKY
ncbi:hypothetical protein [Mucilaginibacter sp.]|uniref:hypothetical protein n=1 Tax=Mucilaginibacter sp. TaxID=1882438 RepID=UPI003267E337